MLLVSDYYKETTDRGSNNHSKCPYSIRLSEDRAEAEEHLIKKCLTDWRVHQDGYELIQNGSPIWRSGDLVCEMDDRIVRIQTWREFSKYANLNPDLEHARLGATKESDLSLLLDS